MTREKVSYAAKKTCRKLSFSLSKPPKNAFEKLKQRTGKIRLSQNKIEMCENNAAMMKC